MAELRRGGISCDAEYAGRSLKGQLTHSRRLGAELTVVAGDESATVRRTGAEDVVVALRGAKERVLALIGR
jgi:histidyl-tRNA synthetase